MKTPTHMGIIPDRNRYWTVNSGMSKHREYNHGLNSGQTLLLLERKFGIQKISYYGFTVENCKCTAPQIQAFSTACVGAPKPCLWGIDNGR